jgi:hypothetical protein
MSWEYDEIFNQPCEGLLKQEFITYKKVRGKLLKETITRRFMGNDDYQDSTSTEVICDA